MFDDRRILIRQDRKSLPDQSLLLPSEGFSRELQQEQAGGKMGKQEGGPLPAGPPMVGKCLGCFWGGITK